MKFISFPRREWNYIKRELRKRGFSTTVRCCKEPGKYKKGDICKTPWGDLIQIIGVKRYSKAESIPTWKKMDKKMKISVKIGEIYGNSKGDYIRYKLKK